jgi:hypothetical protein
MAAQRRVTLTQAAVGILRTVIADQKATYFGTPIDDRSLTPGDNPRLGATHINDWLKAAKTH